MRANNDKDFRYYQYRLGWVSFPLLVESPLSCNVYLTDLLLVYQGSKSTLHHWLAIIANRNQTFSIREKCTHHDEFVPSSRMSCILTEVRIALATSYVQSTLEIPATYEIHMVDRNHRLA